MKCLVMLVVVSAILISPKSWAATPGVTDTEILIGGHTIESGAFVLLGPASIGSSVYFDMINEKGGVHGRKIKFIRVDTQGDQIKSLQAVKKLVEEDKVFAIFGSIGNSHLAVYRYLAEKGVPDLLFSDNVSEYGKAPNKTIFPGKASVESEVQTLVDHAAEKYKKAKICFLVNNTPGGTEFYDLAKAAIEKANAKLSDKEKLDIGTVERVTMTSPQANSQVANLKREKCEVVINTLFGALGPSAITYGVLQKFEPHWLVPTYNSNPKFLELLPQGHRDGVVSLTSLVFEDFGAPGYGPYKSLMEKTKTLEGRASAVGYSLAEIFAEALKRAGKDLTRESLISAMESLTGWQCSLCIEPLSYSPKSHWGFEKVTLLVSKDGKWTKLK